MTEFKDLSSLLEPKSIAIVGASPKETGWPARLWRNLQHFKFPGTIYPVNPRYESIWERRCYPSLDELPEVVDNAIIIVPAPRVVELLTESKDTKFRSAIIMSGGFGEGGDEDGKKRKEFLVAFARERGVHLCGPNCMGLFSMRSRAVLFPDVRLTGLQEGSLAIVSQSGGLVGGLVRATISQGIGISYFVTSGNEVDAELSDYLHHFVQDPNTKVLAALVEGVREAEKFVAVAREALARRKPIIVLKIGRSPKGVAAALAHTGALAGNDRVFEAVCQQNGVISVRDMDELMNTAELFLRVNKLPEGKRAAFVTFSGGLKGLVSDLAYDVKLDLPELRPETEIHLKGLLDVGASVGNPLDAGWGGLSSQETYLRCVHALLAEPDIDILGMQEELPLNGLRPDKESNLMALARIAQESSKPIVVFSMITQSLNDYARQFKERCQLPFLQGANNTIRGLKHLGLLAERARKYQAKKFKPVRSLKPLSPKAKETLARREVLNEWESYQVLEECGISLPKMRIASNSEEAVRAAEELRYPVVLKLIAPGVTHKTELGGVRINLSSAEGVRLAFHEMEAAFRAANPAQLDAFLVQEMVRGGVETIIGAFNDPQFGPVVMFGLGGQSVEIYQDVAFRVAPASMEEAREMIQSIKSYPLLAGFRGKPPVDQETLCQTIVLVSELAAAEGDIIQAIDLNPFIVQERGGKAVDAVIITRAGAGRESKMEDRG
jgi:acetyltransferase